MRAIAVLIEEGVFALLDDGALDLFGGLVALGDLHAVGDPAHFDLGDWRALAGMDVLRGQNDVKLSVELDDVALADRTGDDFHGIFPHAWAGGHAWSGRPAPGADQSAAEFRAATY